MPIIEFEVPLIPRGQSRARAVSIGGRARVFKAAAQRESEESMYAFLQQHVPPQPLSGPVSLEFVAKLPVPKSKLSKFEKYGLEATVKPDLDNLAKMLKDCLTNMRFWHDDKQVINIHAKKKYSLAPGWRVYIYADY